MPATTAKAAQRLNGAAAPAPLRPVPDPPRDIDSMQQFPHTSSFANILIDHFGERPDVFVSGEGYLCRYRGQVIGRLVPDCVAAFGVDPDAIFAANAYILDEVVKPPDFVLEVASDSTARNDYTHKRYAYARYGVREYWRFDPTGGKRHDAPLAGDVLVGDAYMPMELSEGADGLITGYSPALELELQWDEGTLRLYDPAAQSYLLTYAENRIRRQAAEAEIAEHRAAGLAAQARADNAEAASEEHRAARQAAEAEIQRLRAEIARLRSSQ